MSWVCREASGLLLWQAEELLEQPWVRHGFTTRRGGVSRPPYDSLNLGLHVGDDPQAVLSNRERACRALGFGLEDLVCAEQVHGAEAAAVSPADRGRGAERFETALPGVDALTCRCPPPPELSPLLALFFADCLPVFVVDPRRRVLGLAHAGWKGAAAGVAASLLRAMAGRFGTQPEECLAALGPHIRSCCYAVGPEVADRFRGIDGAVTQEDGVLRLSLEAAVSAQLTALGVPGQRIVGGSPCTHCADGFYSYRRDGATGRMAALLGACMG